MFPLFALWLNPARFEPGLGGFVALGSGCPLTTPIEAGVRLCDENCPEPSFWCPSGFSFRTYLPTYLVNCG